MERFGRLAFIAPAESLDTQTTPGKRLFRVQAGSEALKAAILFNEFEVMGITRVDLGLLTEKTGELAEADGNGFAAVLGDMSGVLTADLETAAPPALTISRWGDFASLLTDLGND
jgi:hypothetical protein